MFEHSGHSLHADEADWLIASIRRLGFDWRARSADPPPSDIRRGDRATKWRGPRAQAQWPAATELLAGVRLARLADARVLARRTASSNLRLIVSSSAWALRARVRHSLPRRARSR